MNKPLCLATLLAGSLAIQGCSHGTLNRRIDEKLTQESDVKTRADLKVESVKLIEEASDLSAEQRTQLKSLRSATATQLDAFYASSLKLRSVLIKDLVSSAPDYNEDEVELIKDRLRALDEKRLSVIFSAVEKANSILGRQAAANQKMVHVFFYGGSAGRDN